MTPAFCKKWCEQNHEVGVDSWMFPLMDCGINRSIDRGDCASCSSSTLNQLDLESRCYRSFWSSSNQREAIQQGKTIYMILLLVLLFFGSLGALLSLFHRVKVGIFDDQSHCAPSCPVERLSCTARHVLFLLCGSK